MTGLLASERERGKGSCAMETAVGGTGVDDGDTTVNYDGDGDVSTVLPDELCTGACDGGRPGADIAAWNDIYTFRTGWTVTLAAEHTRREMPVECRSTAIFGRGEQTRSPSTRRMERSQARIGPSHRPSHHVPPRPITGPASASERR